MHVGENIFTLKFINFACSLELRIPDAKVSTMFALSRSRRAPFESYTELAYTEIQIHTYIHSNTNPFTVGNADETCADYS